MSAARPRALSTSAGFTLLELIVAVAISLVLSAAGWGFYRSEALGLSRQSAELDATERLRAALGFCSREIRLAGYDPLGTALVTAGAKGLREATSTSLHIEWDADESGAIDAAAADPAPESVTYAYDAATRRVLRTVNGVADVLASNVPSGGFALEYYDVSGNLLTGSGSPAALSAASRDAVASVVIRLRSEVAGSSPATAFAFAVRAALRSRLLDRL